tara:strand:+ start:3349 stop:3621 length:273 start_codon:yes stop_codon:yes gene_type:complete
MKISRKTTLFVFLIGLICLFIQGVYTLSTADSTLDYVTGSIMIFINPFTILFVSMQILEIKAEEDREEMIKQAVIAADRIKNENNAKING